MKYMKFLFLMCFGCLLITACNAPDAQSDGTTAATTISTTVAKTTPATTTSPEPAVTTTAPAVTTTLAPVTTTAPVTTEEPSLADQMANMGCPEELIPTALREANAEEIASVEAFFSDELVKALLVDRFYTPEEIDLRGFFEWSSCIPDHKWPINAPDKENEELSLACGDLFWLGWDCVKWPAKELNKVTEKYLGVQLEDVARNAMIPRDRDRVQFPGMHYLVNYDAYYMVGPGFSYEPIEIQSVWCTADGNYLVHYKGFTESMVTILVPHEDSYRISLVMELKINPLAPIFWD